MHLSHKLLTLSIPMIVLTGCVSNSGPSQAPDEIVSNYINLAKGYIQEGYSGKALKPLNRALIIAPHSAEVLGFQGLVYQFQGETVPSEKAFKKAIRYDSEASDVRNNYGAFLFSQNRLDEAYENFSVAAKDINYEKRSRAFENMGIVAQIQEKEYLAKENFIKSLKLNANLSRARLELAFILHKHKEFYLAWQHYMVFVKSTDQTSRSLWLGIQLALANNDRSAAASYSLQLKRLHPQSQEFKTMRGNDRGY